MEVGYKLASEEQGPNELVRYAGLAEEHGFGFALISDHFHPWIDRQGQSPFVWSVIGAIAHTTKRLRLGTAVTCPTVRVHPAIVAQAAATAAAMMPDGVRPRSKRPPRSPSGIRRCRIRACLRPSGRS